MSNVNCDPLWENIVNGLTKKQIEKAFMYSLSPIKTVKV
jgi:hypothetical protein